MSESLDLIGLALVCDTCENEIDFPDDSADSGVCRHCGLAFLVERDEPGDATLYA